MNKNSIILGPIVTEKSTLQQEKGIWSFLVAPSSSKTEIRDALQEAFGVHPKKIRVIRVKPQKKMIFSRRRAILKDRVKKALVWLAPGEKIKEMDFGKSKGAKKK